MNIKKSKQTFEDGVQWTLNLLQESVNDMLMCEPDSFLTNSKALITAMTDIKKKLEDNK